MNKIACVVEGHGEVQAMPVLLRRLCERRGRFDITFSAPIRVARDRFLNREDEFSRMVALAALNAGPRGLVLVTLDADDDCPVTLARSVLDRAQPHLRGTHCNVVIANREFEAWLLAGAASLSGRRGLPDSLDAPAGCELIRDAKGWLAERIAACSGGSYSPVTDQAALTAALDLDIALQASRSLRKLDTCIARFLDAGVRA